MHIWPIKKLDDYESKFHQKSMVMQVNSFWKQHMKYWGILSWMIHHT